MHRNRYVYKHKYIHTQYWPLYTHILTDSLLIKGACQLESNEHMRDIYKHFKWKNLYNGTNDYQELERVLWKDFFFHPDKEKGGKSKPEKMIRKKKK